MSTLIQITNFRLPSVNRVRLFGAISCAYFNRRFSAKSCSEASSETGNKVSKGGITTTKVVSSPG